MPLTQLEHDVIAKSCAVAKTLLLDLQPKLSSLSAIHDSEGGTKVTITQEELDEVAALSGLTTAQLNDALNTMTVLLLPAIQNGYANLAQLAARTL